MKDQITKGTRVGFDSEHGPQKGTVIGILQDIGNGQRVAAVEVDWQMSGFVWQVPVNDLQVLAAA